MMHLSATLRSEEYHGWPTGSTDGRQEFSIDPISSAPPEGTLRWHLRDAGYWFFGYGIQILARVLAYWMICSIRVHETMSSKDLIG